MPWPQRLAILAAALWWGSLTAIGGLAVPLLFKTLASPALAGQAAARLFTGQAWLSLGCGVLILLASRGRRGEDHEGLGWGGGALMFVLGGLLLALLGEFAVAPRIVARENLALWHAVGTAMFALQWVCALLVLALLTSGRRTAGVSPAGLS
jgi:hypothetical protein